MAIRRNGEPQTCPTPDKVERAEQCYDAVRLKTMEGKTFPEIAEILKCATSTAYKLFNQGLKLMAPADAQAELHAQRLQLEFLYSDIMVTLNSTSDPGEKTRLYAEARANIEARRRLYGAPDIKVKHVVTSQLDEEIEDLYMKFQDDQDLRTAARARSRKAGK